MSELKCDTIIDVAQEMAKAKGITVHDAQCAMVLAQIEELLGVAKDLSPIGGDFGRRLQELEDRQNAVHQEYLRQQEWIRQVRQGVDAHETKLEAAMDATQTCISNLAELSKAVAQIAGRLPNG